MQDGIQNRVCLLILTMCCNTFLSLQCVSLKDGAMPTSDNVKVLVPAEMCQQALYLVLLAGRSHSSLGLVHSSCAVFWVLTDQVAGGPVKLLCAAQVGIHARPWY